jgi:hypothetical protein
VRGCRAFILGLWFGSEFYISYGTDFHRSCQAQFFFEARLRDEPAPVTAIYFTPDNPLTVLGGMGCPFG